MTGRSSLRLDPPWLHEPLLARLLAALDGNGEEARVVGGAVRNALLGVPVGEVDTATTAIPQEVMRRVQAAGFKAVPTGIEHGTVTAVADGRGFEITTLRKDIETFGRHAKVAFGRDWRSDAERRDFTINAFSMTPDGQVFDYVGGLPDIEKRRVRFIGDPGTRIAEDYLRILRFFRFHAAYGEGPPDSDGLHACILARAGLEQLSRERVRMEMLKLLTAVHAVPVLAVMADAGLLGRVLGGVPLLASFSSMSKLEGELKLPPDAARRLGALGAYVGEDAERLRDRLRLANAEYERIAAMVERWWRISALTNEHEARMLLYRLHTQAFTDRVLLAWSRAPESAHDPRWQMLASLPERWTPPIFPLNAADFIKRGLAKGPALGAALRGAEEAWAAADFPTDPAALDAIADEALRAARPM